MSEDEKLKIKYAKNAIEDYYFLMRIISSKFLEVVSLEEKYGTKSKAVNEDIKHLNKEIDTYLLKTEPVDVFLNKLTTQDRLIIYNLHQKLCDKESYDDYCSNLGFSRSGLYRHVNKLILKHWQF